MNGFLEFTNTIGMYMFWFGYRYRVFSVVGYVDVAGSRL